MKNEQNFTLSQMPLACRRSTVQPFGFGGRRQPGKLALSHGPNYNQSGFHLKLTTYSAITMQW